MRQKNYELRIWIFLRQTAGYNLFERKINEDFWKNAYVFLGTQILHIEEYLASIRPSNEWAQTSKTNSKNTTQSEDRRLPVRRRLGPETEPGQSVALVRDWIIMAMNEKDYRSRSFCLFRDFTPSYILLCPSICKSYQTATSIALCTGAAEKRAIIKIIQALCVSKYSVRINCSYNRPFLCRTL